ncbi:hypothetical protein OsI_38626 [Oryza sativa Indica Group]|uniref:Uncharacterized protein n=1 Tax=Oryza sativa subsp. indica TaxID=39946 RepID=B8BMC5_ORYSI|nr:hypothetical protein OsI_38626 [Oryza sativa Indica Group]
MATAAALYLPSLTTLHIGRQAPSPFSTSTYGIPTTTCTSKLTASSCKVSSPTGACKFSTSTSTFTPTSFSNDLTASTSTFPTTTCLIPTTTSRPIASATGTIVASSSP